jgi:general secretion pathway protein N
MKTKYYFLTGIFSYLIFLVATIPAKPVTDLLTNNSTVIIQGVSGTLWHGKAYMILANNMQFKKTSWSFEPWQLFTGKIAADINTHFLENKISTELGTSFNGRYFVNDLSANISAREIAQLANLPLAQIDGMIDINIKHAHWKQGELPLADGEIKWHNASVTVAETASLGNVIITLSESEKQLLTAKIQNQGGDIKIHGTAALVPEKNYTVDIKLLPTATANNNIRQSLGFFAQKQPNGEYRLNKTGSLDQIM